MKDKYKQYTIAVLIPSNLNPYYLNILNGIQSFLNNFNVNIFSSSFCFSAMKEAKARDAFLDKNVDGLIVVEPFKENIPYYEELSKKLPIVFINSSINSVCHTVSSDFYDELSEAIRKSVDTGHTKFAFIKEENNQWAMFKESQIKRILKDFSLDLTSVCNVGTYDSLHANNIIKRAFEKDLKESECSAFIFSWDFFVQGTYSIIKESENFDKFSFIVFEKNIFYKNPFENISQINTKAEDIGYKTGEMMFTLLKQLPLVSQNNIIKAFLQ